MKPFILPNKVFFPVLLRVKLKEDESNGIVCSVEGIDVVTRFHPKVLLVDIFFPNLFIDIQADKFPLFL